MWQIRWTNVTTGIQRISGVTSRPLGCFVQAGARHKLVAFEKGIGSEGYYEKIIRIGPQGPLPLLSSQAGRSASPGRPARSTTRRRSASTMRITGSLGARTTPGGVIAGWDGATGHGLGQAQPVKPRLSVSRAEAAAWAAAQNIGLTRVLHYHCAEAVRDGSLQIILEDFEIEPLPVHLVHAARGALPLKMRAFLDFAVGG
jgi:hypothetical protein